jgi:hypothetical protein
MAGNDGVHPLRENDAVTVEYSGHPPRADSPEYLASRKWMLAQVHGGCYVCGGPVDLSHPAPASDGQGMQDHHGNPLFVHHPDATATLVGFGLIPSEWAGGWGADPALVQKFALLHHLALQRLADPGVNLGSPPIIKTTDDVMAWIDSTANAAVKLCAPHHVGPPDAHTPAANGHEAVGIHHVPFPIWTMQATHDWTKFDLFAGTTGTVAVAAPRQDGSVLVLHADAVAHPELHAAVQAGIAVIPADHPLAIAAAA